jgi:hypothetical protein
MKIEIKDKVGNEKILSLPSTAFLCSRKIVSSIVLECYDWAINERKKGTCVISGFHSDIEKDVFHFLSKGTQPIIYVLNCGLKKEWDRKVQSMLDCGRLLIITPFEKEVERGTDETGIIRNQLVLELAKEIKYGHISESGNLRKLEQIRLSCGLRKAS